MYPSTMQRLGDPLLRDSNAKNKTPHDWAVLQNCKCTKLLLKLENSVKKLKYFNPGFLFALLFSCLYFFFQQLKLCSHFLWFIFAIEKTPPKDAYFHLPFISKCYIPSISNSIFGEVVKNLNFNPLNNNKRKELSISMARHDLIAYLAAWLRMDNAHVLFQ